MKLIEKFKNWRIKRLSKFGTMLFYIYDKDPALNEDAHLLTILSDKEQISEFLIRYDCFSEENEEHYQSWAELRNLDPNDNSTMFLYSISIDEDRTLYVEQVLASPEVVATLFRKEHHILPLGSSYESKEEKQIFDLSEGNEVNMPMIREILLKLISEGNELLNSISDETQTDGLDG